MWPQSLEWVKSPITTKNTKKNLWKRSKCLTFRSSEPRLWSVGKSRSFDFSSLSSYSHESTSERVPSQAGSPSRTPRWLMGYHSPVCVPQSLAVLSPLITANERPRADSQHKHAIVYSAASCQRQRRPINTDFSLSWPPERRNEEEKLTATRRCL